MTSGGILSPRAGAALAALTAYPTIGVAQRPRYQVGYGLYGMRNLPYMEGLAHIARIGYKHAEITLRPGWNTEPRLLTRANRTEIRQRIGDLGLTLVDVMEGMKGVYDYGHFMAFGLGLEETIRQVAPRAGFVHIKDAVGKAPDHHFVLPGDGGVDYSRFLKTMAEVGYRGPIVVEVSTDVFSKPGYDPIATAQRMWDRLSPIFAT